MLTNGESLNLASAAGATLQNISTDKPAKVFEHKLWKNIDPN